MGKYRELLEKMEENQREHERLEKEIREIETSANMEKTDRKSFKKDEIQKINSQYQKIKQYSRRADYGHSLETGIYRRYGSQKT